MIPQLINRLAPPVPPPGNNAAAVAAAGAAVLTADPLDLILHMEQVWQAANPLGLPAAPAAAGRPALLALSGVFPAPAAGPPQWDHLGFAFVLENTRVVQIIHRVVRAFRSGEGLGVPSMATQRWLDATEALLFGAASPLAGWLSTSTVRPEAEAVRRNAYWRLFSRDLAFGTETNRPFEFDRAEATNTNFIPLFEELLHELWKAIENVRNIAGANAADDDRIGRLAEEIGFLLRSRRQNAALGREELAAVTALGWLELTLSANTPLVVDLRAQATTPANRLRLIGERVGLAPHSRAGSLFSMAADLSTLLRVLESGVVTNAGTASILYNVPPVGGPPAFGVQSRRVITEWAAASGQDLKQRARPVVTMAARPMVGAR